MSARVGFRIAVVGATGALGSELLAELDRRSLPVREIVPIATEESLGEEIEFQGEAYPITCDPRALEKADLAFFCVPAAAALDYAALALRARVPALDLSGALVHRDEVPLLLADAELSTDALRSPLVAIPSGPALGWTLVLSPLSQAFGLTRIVGTHLEAASGGGRGGMESLSAETVALFNQQEAPEPAALGYPIAFDCVPWVGEFEAHGPVEAEARLTRVLERVLAGPPRVAVSAVRVPTFVGHGATLAVETEREVEPAEAVEVLRGAPGVEVWNKQAGPSTRAGAGRDVVLVGRVRRDPSHVQGLLLWLAADALRLVATHAVQLADARLRLP